MRFKHALLGGLVLLVAACTAKYVREVTTEPFTANDELVARGSYLVNNVASCGACHTGRADGKLTSTESTERYLAGGLYVEEPAMNMAFYIPNITPHKEDGIGAWSDDEIARAIRDGINRDGKLMMPMMPYPSYQYMSDEDVKAVVAYLRSVPPLPNEKEPQASRIPFMFKLLMKMGVTAHAPVQDVKTPDPSDQVAYGKYLADLGHCEACHNAGKKGPRKPGDRYMAGGDMEMVIPEVGTLYASNLTPDKKTGLGELTADEIKHLLTAGVRKDGTRMAPPMSLFIPHVSGMTDEDLDCLVAWMQSLEPVENEVPKRSLTHKWVDIVKVTPTEGADEAAEVSDETP